MILIFLFALWVAYISARRPLAGVVLAANAFLFGALAEQVTGLDGSIASVVLPATCLIAIVVTLYRAKRLRYYSLDLLDFLFVTLSLLMLSSSLYSDFPSVSMDYALRFSALGVGFFVMAKLAIARYEAASSYVDDMVWGCLIAALFFGSAALIGGRSSSDYVTRLTIGNVSSIPLAICLGLGLIAGLTVMVRSRLGWRRTALLALSLCVIGYAFIAANTRSVMLGTGAAVLAAAGLGKLRLSKSGLRAVMLAVVGGGLGIVIVVMQDPDLMLRSASGFGRILSSDLGESETERIAAWQASWASIREAPLLGSGAGVFTAMYGMYPHNIILEVAAELGIAGAALLLSILAVAVVRCARRRSGTDPVVVMFFSFLLVVAMVSLSFWMHKMLFLCVAVISASSYHRAGKKAAL